jgi:hypothetical protein
VFAIGVMRTGVVNVLEVLSNSDAEVFCTNALKIL